MRSWTKRGASPFIRKNGVDGESHDLAQLSGTGVAMIEKHYGHLVRDDAEEALASIAI